MWVPGSSFLAPYVTPYVAPEVYGGVPDDPRIGKEVAPRGSRRKHDGETLVDVEWPSTR